MASEAVINTAHLFPRLSHRWAEGWLQAAWQRATPGVCSGLLSPAHSAGTALPGAAHALVQPEQR